MKKLTTLSVLLISLAFVVPVQASAATSAGVKPGSFFYFFDTTFENVSLFFTFDSENKAKKALGYADERLAEIEAIAEEKNPNAVKTAIANYESNMALATEKSKDVKDKRQAESLLTIIADNTSKHQEVLTNVLGKVPEEAKEAITQAIEASRKGQEEAIRQIAELKGEVEQLKQEVADLKTKDEEKGKIIEELSKQKPETTSKPNPVPTSIKPTSPKTSDTTLAPKPATIPPPNQIKTNETQVTQPPVQPPSNNTTNTTPAPTAQTQTSTTIEISSVNITPTITSAKIEWQTDKPTESKIFLSGGGLSSKLYNSESGLSTRHSVSIESLKGDTAYSYEIEAVGNVGIYAKKSGSFSTALPVASKIFARPRYSSSNTLLEVAGANCEPADYWVSIYDQDGKEMDGVDVTISAPFMTVTEKTRQEDYTRAKIHAFFRYNTPATSTTETITFTSGNLSTSATLHVGNRLAEYVAGHPLTQSGSYWYESSGGSRVDPVKMMCL